MSFYTWIVFAFVKASIAAPYQCPEQIETKQSLSKAVIGWTGVVDKLNGATRLDSIELSLGHPNDGAILAPDNKGGSGAPVWTFSGKSEADIWMACLYTQSHIRLIRKLPKGTSRCTLKYLQSPTRIEGISCQ